MANKKGRRRRFGAVRQYRSGRWTASYIGPDGVRIHAPETFATKKEAEIWLSQIEADLTRGDWRAPDAGAVNFKIYAEKWVEERELAVRTVDLYEHLFRLYIFPTFGALDLDEITAPRVREWRAERLRTTKAKTMVAKAYRLVKSIMETAVDDELISRNPCRIKARARSRPPSVASPPSPRWTPSPKRSAFVGASWSTSARTGRCDPRSWPVFAAGTSTPTTW